MPKYAKANTTTKHERDRARRQLAWLNWPSNAEIEAFSNPVAPPQHDNAVQLEAWAAHLAAGYIVR